MRHRGARHLSTRSHLELNCRSGQGRLANHGRMQDTWASLSSCHALPCLTCRCKSRAKSGSKEACANGEPAVHNKHRLKATKKEVNSTRLSRQLDRSSLPHTSTMPISGVHGKCQRVDARVSLTATAAIEHTCAACRIGWSCFWWLAHHPPAFSPHSIQEARSVLARNLTAASCRVDLRFIKDRAGDAAAYPITQPVSAPKRRPLPIQNTEHIPYPPACHRPTPPSLAPHFLGEARERGTQTSSSRNLYANLKSALRRFILLPVSPCLHAASWPAPASLTMCSRSQKSDTSPARTLL